ncbi:mitoferrin-2 isoform X2 [Zonotrichia leucophrys gambelii]|uniref:mitoferrin-2 isoform X2 n=1 Tax=Zonotrichia leucophrys gambelii TaxID=257770 RepID=UPI00313FF848
MGGGGGAGRARRGGAETEVAPGTGPGPGGPEPRSPPAPDYEALPQGAAVSTHMLAGAVAGVMEHCVMYPIDCVKTRMQSLQPEPAARYRNVLEALWRIARTEGVWRPMRGLNITATGAGPAHALYFACYEKLKKTLSDVIHAGGNSHVANAMSQPHGAGHGDAPRLQSCRQVAGLKRVGGPGSGGCWWTGAACRQAGTGCGPVGRQCQSSPQERHVVLEPVSPWCPLPVSRTRHSRGSMGLRGEQGTFCPWQACSKCQRDVGTLTMGCQLVALACPPKSGHRLVPVTPWDMAACHYLPPLFLYLSLGGNP